jgi:hypothetical protein
MDLRKDGIERQGKFITTAHRFLVLAQKEGKP